MGGNIRAATHAGAGVNDEGEVRLFLELNGQPRPIRVGKAGLESTRKSRAKAEEGNPKHVATPMPGAIGTVAVKAGQKVSKGNPLTDITSI